MRKARPVSRWGMVVSDSVLVQLGGLVLAQCQSPADQNHPRSCLLYTSRRQAMRRSSLDSNFNVNDLIGYPTVGAEAKSHCRCDILSFSRVLAVRQLLSSSGILKDGTASWFAGSNSLEQKGHGARNRSGAHWHGPLAGPNARVGLSTARAVIKIASGWVRRSSSRMATHMPQQTVEKNHAFVRYKCV